MIRFVIKQGENVTLTVWEDEPVKAGPSSTATQRMTQLRSEYGPTARISIERDPVPPRAPREWVQFILTHKENSVHPEGTQQMSNAVPVSQADAVLAELRRDYPKAAITRRGWVK